ncbi:MAG TPA: hypothetical protein EYP67_03945, partial [Methanosarcinales archaeon]|nr:hypothetical protein [Methanosarcinales archaeon]
MHAHNAIITLALIALLCGTASAALIDLSATQDRTLTKVDPKLIELALDENIVEPAKLADPKMQMMVSDIETIPT